MLDAEYEVVIIGINLVFLGFFNRSPHIRGEYNEEDEHVASYLKEFSVLPSLKITKTLPKNYEMTNSLFITASA